MNSTPGNSELLRLHYLQAMGISSYYPRFRLPAALPSQPCPWPQAIAEAAPVTPVAQQPAATGMATPENAPQSPRPRPTSAELPATKPKQVTVVSRPAESAQSGALQFQLLLLAVDTELALLCQIPALSKPQLQDRQARLLHNLLRWLGKALPANAAPRRFQWPLPGMPLHDDQQQAVASLGHFVQQAAVEQPFRHLLLLGGQLAEQLASTAFVPDTCQLTVIPGLDEMLALPQQKRDAWQALLPLHAALQARQS
jgi:hypothetical protein